MLLQHSDESHEISSAKRFRHVVSAVKPSYSGLGKLCLDGSCSEQLKTIDLYSAELFTHPTLCITNRLKVALLRQSIISTVNAYLNLPTEALSNYTLNPKSKLKKDPARDIGETKNLTPQKSGPKKDHEKTYE